MSVFGVVCCTQRFPSGRLYTSPLNECIYLIEAAFYKLWNEFKPSLFEIWPNNAVDSYEMIESIGEKPSPSGVLSIYSKPE